ncbi:Tex family protein [Nakamurella flava]|uniref:Tex family protein n=1 Tax=Nakamurella flava TaxID=2576308 RepID=UPI0023EF51D7|nr:Tex family protein [Nakamurella flava]
MTSAAIPPHVSRAPGSGPAVPPDPDPAAVTARVGRQIAEELGVAPWQVAAAVELLDGGATVPFVARYRKEVTGSLDDTQLRTLTERLGYLRDLEDRRATVLASIRQQGKLTDDLAAAIATADTKSRLEDIYLPYRPKRRTKAQIAREAGLQPLAERLLADPTLDPHSVAAGFLRVDPTDEHPVPDTAAALAGARSILVERFSEHADLVGGLRELVWQHGRLTSAVVAGKEADGAKFSDYFDYSEPLSRIPSHRMLALLRGEKDGVLTVRLDPEPAVGDGAVAPTGPGRYEQRIALAFGIADLGRPADGWLLDTVRWGWRTRLLVGLEVDLRLRLRQAAEQAAVGVFAVNLRDLLLAAPAGGRPTLGLDPGFRTGVKVAVVDGTGKVVATDTIHPHQPHNRWDAAVAGLSALVAAHGVELIAIGNGTASRETEKLASAVVAAVTAAGGPAPTPVMVSEAGASVYSASAYAAGELPDLDVTIRGAVSIARRLQDPLAELVKIDPKSIGVGQYQHDITEGLLARSLDAVVEDCVNAVGVDLNTASAPLLRRVSGITTTLAENIVTHREANGPFRTRAALSAVPRLGPRAFEQCAGFLRVRGGDEPLDASSVHPEAYPVARRIAADAGVGVGALIGNTAVLQSTRPQRFVDDRFGLPTVTDILSELEKPGRDPRPDFRTATFTAGIEKISDLRPGMVVEGAVTNVAAFGAFVDIGVHQDGLVHVSAMSDQFVSDPRTVVRSGDVVKVKVMSVDVDRKRIGLSLRLDDEIGAENSGGTRGGSRPPAGAGRRPAAGGGRRGDRAGSGAAKGTSGLSGGVRGGQAAGGSMADALRRAGFGR